MEIIKKRTYEKIREVNDRINNGYSGGVYYATRIQNLLPLEEKRIIRCIGYLETLIFNSEKDGTFGLRPHSSIMENKRIIGLRINN